MLSESACRLCNGAIDKLIKPGVFQSRVPADDVHVELNPPVEMRAESLHGVRNPKGDMNNARGA